jgi:hypothetical protein
MALEGAMVVVANRHTLQPSTLYEPVCDHCGPHVANSGESVSYRDYKYYYKILSKTTHNGNNS